MPQTPPPDPNRALLDLIVQLRDAKSPLARVRVIARAWRTVRGLTPKQRYEIAVHLGLDGADDLIEAIAAHQGTTPPPELMQAVNEVQKMDPATVKGIAARIRNPQQRAEGIRQGLKAIEDVLAGPAPPPPPSKPPAPGTPSWLPKGVSPTPPPPVPPAPPTPPVIAKPATSWPLREAPSQPKPAPAPTPVAAPAPPPSPPPPVPAPVDPPAPAPVATPAVVAPAPVPPPSPPAPVEPPAPAPVRAGLAEHLGSIPALTARFRHFRRHLGQVRRLSVAELRALLEVFPDGWARRRALSELIDEGVPARAADVLSLVDVLQSPGDRGWCLSALADSRTLSAEERAAVLQAAATPAGRRRLELRLGER